MGTGSAPNPFPPLQPGVNAKFQVTLTFTTTPFALVPGSASVVSSDPANFPVAIDSSDPTIIDADIPSTAAPVIGQDGGEDITVTWSYKNVDGTVVNISGTVTEEGITDDVTGGTFARIA